MSDATKRLSSWRAKFTPERAREALDARYADMARRYEAQVAILCAVEAQVKQVLNSRGVPTILYVAYLNFGRQLYRLSRQQDISGESLAMAAQAIIEKYASQRLDRDTLAAIRTEVFDSPAPRA